MAGINGKWALVSSENFDSYLKAIGVSGDNLAKALSLMDKTGENGYMEEICVEGDSVKRTLYVNGQPHGPTSPLVPFGKEIETTSLDGRPIKVTLKCEGNKFIRHETGPNYTSVNTSVISGNDRVLTMTTGSVVCTRKFKKV